MENCVTAAKSMIDLGYLSLSQHTHAISWISQPIAENARNIFESVLGLTTYFINMSVTVAHDCRLLYIYFVTIELIITIIEMRPITLTLLPISSF